MKPMTEEHSHTFLNSSHSLSDNFAVINPQAMRFVDASPSTLAMLGYTREEMLQKTPQDIDAVFTNDIIQALFNNIICSADQHSTVPSIYKRKDNSTFEVQVYIRCETRGDEKFIITSVTEKSVLKTAEEKLRFHAALFNSIPDAVVSTDGQFRIASYNNYAQEIFGWEEGEAIGRYTRDVTASVYPNATSDEVRDELFIKGFWKGEVITHRKSGEAFPAMISVGVVKDDNENNIGTVCVTRDITTGKKLEQELKNLNEHLEQRVEQKTAELTQVFERISDGFMALDNQWNCTYINKKAAEIMNQHAKELIGKNVWTEFPKPQFSHSYEDYYRAMVEQKPIHTEAYVADYKKWFAATLYPSPEGISVYFQDITDERNAKLALEESEVRYRTIVETSQEGILQIDTTRHIRFVNNFMAVLLGYEKEAITGKPFNHFVHTDSLQVATTLLKEGQSLEPVQHELTFVRKDGSLVYTLLQLSPFFNAGKFAGSIATVLDITSKKKAEEQLAASERRFSALFQHSLDGVALLSEKGIITDASPSVEKITGIRIEDLVNVPHLKFILPEYITDLRDTFLAVLNNPLLFKTIQYEAMRPDGNLVWIESTYSNLLHEPAVSAIVCNFRDITARKVAEKSQRFKADLLNAVGQAVIATDLLGNVTYWNKAATDHYGWSEEEAFSKNILDLTITSGGMEHAVDIMSSLMQGQPWTGEFTAQRKDGTTFPAVVVDTPVYDEKGRLAGIIGVSTNISERKKIENEIKESEARYRKAQAMGKLGHWTRNLLDNTVSWSDEIYSLLQINKDTTTLDFDSYLNLIHPDDRNKIRTEISKTLDQGKPLDFVSRIVLADGSIRYMHEMAELIKDDAGRPVQLTGMVQDITEQKLGEQALLLSEKNYRLLFEENPVPLCMADTLPPVFIDVNRAAVDQYGYTKEEFVGMKTSALSLPDEECILESAGISLEEGKTINYAVSHRKKNGDIIQVSVKASVIVYNERKVWLIAGRDITQEFLYEDYLKKSQEQLSLIFNSTQSAMWLLKVEEKEKLRFEAVNDALEKEVGIKKEDMIGRLINEVFATDEYRSVISRYNECLRNGNVHKSTFAIQKNGVELFFQITFLPIKDDTGNIVQILGIGENITAQKKAETKVIESEEKYRILFEQSPLPKLIFEKESLRILELNVAATKLYGYSREEFQNMTLFDIRPLEKFDDLKNFFYNGVPNSYVFDTIHSTKTGALMKVNITANYIRYENKDARIMVILDRTEQEKAKDELMTTTQNLRDLASHLQHIREEERTDIAREIHDELGQQLTGLKMDISWLSKKLQTENESIKNKIQTSLELVDMTINTVRKIATQLRPSILDDLGLAEAIDWHSSEFSKRTDTPVNFDTDITDSNLPPAISTGLFRIYQESLTNIARHANATAIHISLKINGNNIILIVADNGTGFNLKDQTQRKTLGLLGIRERVTMLNGQFTIDSTPAAGTQVFVQIPLAN